MQLRLLDLLACPKCGGRLSCAPSATEDDGTILSGMLECTGCRAGYPILAGIPRFVQPENYASSFGYQWNQFKFAQVDSYSGLSLSARRWYAETGWTKEWIEKKWVLDVGCGAGRFLDIASRWDCEVVGMDISNAIEAAAVTMKGRKNVHLVQASIYELPFRAGAFDACYCIGVIQHTPDPDAALRSLPRVLTPGGRLAVTIYERKPWTLLNSKYLVRPLTKRLGKRTLLAAIRILMPVLFVATEVLFRLPYLGRVLAFVIPVANYVHMPDLSAKQRYEWAVLDTFDMLSPRYDQPMTQDEAERPLAAAGIVRLQRLPNPGLNLTGERAP
jgi:SAM-dependent methyltransferase/uncharacterized protein YbaR (Trm112 family)